MEDPNEVESQELVEQLKRLPEENILEILGKLPLRDLMVFRCVSKFWCSQLDNNPEFVCLAKDSFSLMLILDNRVYSLDNNTLSLSASIEGRFKKIHCPLVPLGWNFKYTNFVGSCCGLFCMFNEDNKQVCLWDPCTNEIRFLPKSGFRSGFQVTEKNDDYVCPCCKPYGYGYDSSDDYVCAYCKGHGFGYDSKNDDYKYVRIFYLPPSESVESVVHIYSFRTNTWKQMYVPYVLSNVSSSDKAPNGVFYNGFLHWFARNKSSYCLKVLLAFDMTEESVREIPQPANSDVKNFGMRYVDVLDGCLCILYSNSAGFQVWVMKEYGTRESWTMMYNISGLTVLKFKSFVDLKRIECLKTGELLLEVHSDDGWGSAALVLYDPKNETARVLKLRKDLGRYSVQSLFLRYVKSLVKLNSGSQVGEDDSETNNDDDDVVHTNEDDESTDGNNSTGAEEDILGN